MIITMSTAYSPPMTIDTAKHDDVGSQGLLKTIKPRVTVSGLLGSADFKPEGTVSYTPSVLSLLIVLGLIYVVFALLY